MSELENRAMVVFTTLDQCLIATFPSSLGGASSDHIMAQTLERCAQQRFRAVIFDLSPLELIDLSEWEWLSSLANSVRLMGSSPWFAGLRPSVVATLVTLNAPIPNLPCALGVEDALKSSR